LYAIINDYDLNGEIIELTLSDSNEEILLSYIINSPEKYRNTLENKSEATHSEEYHRVIILNPSLILKVRVLP
jgi:hypothetical protein